MQDATTQPQKWGRVMDKDAIEDAVEAEITPEMRKAGFNAYFDADLRFCDVEDRILLVYLAMETVRRMTVSTDRGSQRPSLGSREGSNRGQDDQ